MNIKRISKEKSNIDMTPVIDVVFQLLAFFMITSTMIKTSAINVDLPTAQTSDAQPIREAVVTIYKTGNLSLNDETIVIDNLGIELKELYIENNDLVVTIRGDKDIDYGTLIKVMDTVRLIGIQRMSLATTLTEAES